MTNQQPQKQDPKVKQAAAAALILASVGVAVPITQRWEGYVNHVYKDPAGIPTYCYGETQNISRDPTRIYAKTECAVLLRQREARDYAPVILKCIPELNDGKQTWKYVFGSLIDASYNTGPYAICKSSMAYYIHHGYWKAACQQLPTFYITARSRTPKSPQYMRAHGWNWNGKYWWKKLDGLVSRRQDEERVCLTNL